MSVLILWLLPSNNILSCVKVKTENRRDGTYFSTAFCYDTLGPNFDLLELRIEQHKIFAAIWGFVALPLCRYLCPWLVKNRERTHKWLIFRTKNGISVLANYSFGALVCVRQASYEMIFRGIAPDGKLFEKNYFPPSCPFRLTRLTRRGRAEEFNVRETLLESTRVIKT